MSLKIKTQDGYVTVGGNVHSVNGKAGAVNLTADDVGALPDSTVIPTVPTDDITANTTARHSHDNKSALDGITTEKVSLWDNKVTSPTTAGTSGQILGLDSDLNPIWVNDNVGANVVISDSEPQNQENGDLWFDTTEEEQEEVILEDDMDNSTKITFVSSGTPISDSSLSLCAIISYNSYESNTITKRATLIDMGSDEYAIDLMATLEDLGVQYIDAIIMTHWHGDHWKGLSAIDWTNKKLGTVDASNTTLYCPHGGLNKDRLTEEAYDSISGYVEPGETYINKHRSDYKEITYPTEDEVIIIGGREFKFNNVSDAKFLANDPISTYSFFRNQNNTAKTGPSYNNFSMIITLTTNYGHKVVFSGDVEFPAEKANNNIPAQADIFQINHHGLNVQSPAEWLSSINAKYSVIPIYGSMYNDENWEKGDLHPVVRRCAEVGTVYSTEYKNVVFVSKEDNLYVESGEIVSIPKYDTWQYTMTKDNILDSKQDIISLNAETRIEKRGEVIIFNFKFSTTADLAKGVIFYNFTDASNVAFADKNFIDTFRLTQAVAFSLTAVGNDGTTISIPANVRWGSVNVNGISQSQQYVTTYADIPANYTVYGQAVAFMTRTMYRN